MVISYRLEERDLHDLQAQVAALRRAGVWPFLAGIAAGAAVGWPLWAALHPGRATLPLLRTFLVLLAAAAAFTTFLRPLVIRFRPRRLDAWATRRLARAAARRSVLGPVTVELVEDGIVRRNERGELRLDRAEVRDVLASPGLLTVRPRRAGPVILLPERAFADAAAFAAARARIEALAGAPAVVLDPERGTVARPGGVRAPLLRPELGVALVLALAAWGADALAARAHDPRRTNPPGHVVLYATAWCPACDRLRACLGDSGVPYEERDVERSPEADAEWNVLGATGVPVTLVGSDPVFGLDRPRLAETLGAAGHRFECPAP